jgi:hypothetical protein
MAKKKTSSKKKSKPTAQKKTGPKGPRKRPISDQDFIDFESLCEIQCTVHEICSIFKCSDETLIERIQERYNNNFSAIYNGFRAGGKESLRRMMWKKALEGDGQTQRWLSRQYLGMSDKIEVNDQRASEESGTIILEPAERLKRIHGETSKP